MLFRSNDCPKIIPTIKQTSWNEFGKEIDYEEVYKQIAIMKERAIRFLFNALQKSSYATTSNQF